MCLREPNHHTNHHVTICVRELKAEATLIPDCLDINFPTDLVYFIAFFLLPQKLP